MQPGCRLHAMLSSQDAFDGQTLANLLQRQGLAKPIRDALLYAVAMADVDQEADWPSTRTPVDDAAANFSGRSCGPDVNGETSAGQASPTPTHAMTAAEGKAAFGRYLASVGRQAACT